MYSLPILELLQDSHDPPATPESLEELEIELGVRFPWEYKNFLLQFNGGTFRRPVMFHLPNPTDWINEVGVDWFYGDPCDRGLGCVLPIVAQMFEGRIPDDCLAIADCGTDSILLQVAGPEPEVGRVWFWDSVDEGEGNNSHWIADSFSAFLAMLEFDAGADYEDRESIPIFLAIESGNLRAAEGFLSEGATLRLATATEKPCWRPQRITRGPKLSDFC